MLNKRTMCAAFVTTVAVLVLAVSQIASAAEASSRTTVITIDGEMCGGCVKKIQAALAEVPGIAKVEGDLKAKTVAIAPSPKVELSPRALWVAVEKAGKKPILLAGPHGTFRSKPKT